MARILYIDDQVASQKLVESLLKTAGHQVVLASDGHDGLEKMQAHTFDVILTDAIMPGGVSGYDVTKTIRKQHGPDKLPILLITGRRERRDVEKAIEAGITDYVVKPIDPKSLLAKVDVAVKQKAQRAADAANEIPVAEIATMSQSLNVTGISERGVTLRSSQPLRIGSDVDLGEDFFRKIGLGIAPHLVVSQCEAVAGHQFRIEAKFFELDASSVAALRLWITFKRVRKSG